MSACCCEFKAGELVHCCLLHWRMLELIERATPHMAHDANWMMLAAEQPKSSDFPLTLPHERNRRRSRERESD